MPPVAAYSSSVPLGVQPFSLGVSGGPVGASTSSQPSSEAVEAALNQQLDWLQHHVSNLRLAREQAARSSGTAEADTAGVVCPSAHAACEGGMADKLQAWSCTHLRCTMHCLCS